MWLCVHHAVGARDRREQKPTIKQTNTEDQENRDINYLKKIIVVCAIMCGYASTQSSVVFFMITKDL